MTEVADPFAEFAVKETPFDPFAEFAVPDIEALGAPAINAPHGLVNAAIASLQSSVTGMLARGGIASVQGRPISEGLPTQTLPQDATDLERFVHGATGIVADLPFILMGVAGGGAAGTAMAGPGPGTVVGAGAGGFGLPRALRGYLMEAYKREGIRSFADLAAVSLEFAKGGTHGAIIGATTAMGGAAVGAITVGAVRAAAVPLAELASMTTMAASLEGRAPTLQEFQDNALLITAGRAIPAVSHKLMDLYAQAGIEPAQAAEVAKGDPTFRKQLLDPAHEGVPDKFAAVAAAENLAMAVPDPLPKGAKAQAIEFLQDPFAPIGNRPDGKAYPTHFNYNYTNSPLDVQMALSKLSAIYEPQIQAKRGGVKGWDTGRAEAETILADTLGIRKSKIQDATKSIDPAKLEAHLRAAAQMAEGFAADMVRKSEAAASAGAEATPLQISEALAAAHRTSMFYAEFLGLRAETARAFNALKDAQRSALDPAAFLQAVEKHGGIKDVHGLIQIIAAVKSAAAANRAANGVTNPSLLGKTITYWKAVNLLSGPETFQANLFGNIIPQVLQFPERIVVAAVGAAKHAVGKAIKGDKWAEQERAGIHEAASAVKGMYVGALDGLHVAAETLRNETRGLAIKHVLQEVRAKTPQAGSIDTSAPAFTARVKELINDPIWLAKALSETKTSLEQTTPSTGEKADYWARTPFRVLTATDALFRTMSERAEAYALSDRQATKEGFSSGTREFNRRVVELVNNPDAAVLAKIEAAGDHNVYTTSLSPRMRHLQLAVHGSVWEFVMPFIKTPINLLRFAGEFIPGTPLLMASSRADLFAGGVRADKVIARQLIGTAIMAVVVEGVAAGTITGSGEADPESADARRAAGIPNYSIKIGEEWYNYRRLQPLATVVSVAADVAEIFKASGNPDQNVAMALSSALATALVSQTYMQGLSNMVHAITDQKRYAARWLDQYAASMVPGSALLSQVASSLDSTQREINSIFDAIQARIPVWREQLLPVRNPLTGEPVKQERPHPLSPIKTVTESKDLVLQEAARLGVNISAAPRKIHIGTGTGKIGDVKIDDKHRNEFVRVQGEQFHEIMSELVNSPDWAITPDIIKKNFFRKAMSMARMQAAFVALPVEAREAEIDRITQEVEVELRK